MLHILTRPLDLPYLSTLYNFGYFHQWLYQTLYFILHLSFCIDFDANNWIQCKRGFYYCNIYWRRLREILRVWYRLFHLTYFSKTFFCFQIAEISCDMYSYLLLFLSMDCQNITYQLAYRSLRQSTIENYRKYSTLLRASTAKIL